MKNIILNLILLILFFNLNACKKEGNGCSGFGGPSSDEMLRLYGGDSLENAINHMDGNFYHFKTVKRFGASKSNGYLSEASRIPKQTGSKIVLDGSLIESFNLAAPDAEQVSKAPNRSDLIRQKFGTNTTVTEYLDDRNVLFNQSVQFPEDIFVSNPVPSDLNSPFYSNTQLHWNASSLGGDAYIVLFADNDWPVFNKSILTPLYNVIKVPDNGYYQFKQSDFDNFPVGTNFCIYVSRGRYLSFKDSYLNKNHVIVATTHANATFKYAGQGNE